MKLIKTKQKAQTQNILKYSSKQSEGMGQLFNTLLKILSQFAQHDFDTCSHVYIF